MNKDLEKTINKYVYKISNYYYKKFDSFFSLEDLQQIGFEGACRACEKYKEDKGCSLTSYIYKYIQWNICNYIRSNKNLLNNNFEDIADISEFNYNNEKNIIKHEEEIEDNSLDIQSVVEKAPTKYKSLLKDIYINHYSIEDVAKSSNKSIPYIKKELLRGIKRTKKAIDKIKL